jgi:hypothetical protein
MRYRRHKYGASKVEIDGYRFDSKAEARRYQELVLLQKANRILNLECHPKFDIGLNGVKICTVILDFSYIAKDGWKYEDIKGIDTPVSRLKRKLLHAFYGIEVEVIRR